MDLHSLPPAVRSKLSLLVRRFRCRMALRWLCRASLVLAAVLLAAYGADMWIGLGRGTVRALDVGLVLALSIVALYELRRPPGLAAFAGLVEQSHPELAEGLSTLVNLKEGHGHPQFSALLARQIELQVEQLDLRPLLARLPLRKPLLGTGAAMLFVLSAALVLPGFGAFTQRFVLAWGATPAWRVEVSPGSTALFHGGAVRVTARLISMDEGEPEPIECTLITRSQDGTGQRRAMVASTPGAFTVELHDLQADLTYTVEAAGARSEEYRLTVVEPVELAKAPMLHLLAPPYVAPDVHPARTLTLDQEVIATQYGGVNAEFVFTRPPRHASLVMKSGDSAVVLPLVAGEGALASRVEHRLSACGSFQIALALEMEHGLTSTLPLPSWTVVADTPPRFSAPLRIHGLAPSELLHGEHRIPPQDLVKAEVLAEDVEGLDAIDFEYRINNGPPRLEPWQKAAGKTRLQIADYLPLPRELKEGDQVRVRLRAADNRRLKKGALGQAGSDHIPPLDLEPQVAYEPAAQGKDRWLEFRIDSSAVPLLERAILVQRELAHGLLATLQRRVQQEQKQVAALKEAPETEQQRQAAEVRRTNDAIALEMLRAAEKVSALPALAEPLQDLARGEMAKAGESIERFKDAKREVQERTQDLGNIEDALAQAVEKLQRLDQKNQALAQDQLDPVRLARLARRQDELQRRLKELLDKQPDVPADLARLREEQAKLEADLQALGKQSRMLQEALAARLAREAEKLAAQQRQASDELDKELARKLAEGLPGLRSRQQTLAQSAEQLAGDGDPPALAALRAALEALKQGRLEQAATPQRLAEQELRNWAEQLREAPAGTRAAAARQARAQQGLRDDLLRLGEDFPRLNEQMLRERLADLVARQKAVQEALGKLARDARAEPARQQAQRARELLQASEALAALEVMEKLQQTLEQLTTRLPEATPTPAEASAAKKKADELQAMAEAQMRLRQEGEKLLADAQAKADPGLQRQAQRLAQEMHKLAQESATPEAASKAKDSAQGVEHALKAMAEARNLQAQ